MKVNIFWFLSNVIFVILSYVQDTISLLPIFNAFAAGLIFCAICIDWMEGKRPWKTL